MNRLLFHSIARIMERQSLKTLSQMGKGVGLLMWYLLPERRKRAIASISFHLGLDYRQAKILARKNFQHTGRSFLEIFYNPKIGQEFIEKHLTINRPSLLKDLISRPQPIVATTGHMGAWELLSGLMAIYFHHRPTQIVVREPENQALRLLMRKFRGRGTHEIVHRDNSALRILSSLKKGGITAFLVDHNCGAHKAVFLPFFKRIAAVNFGPALIAIRARALVCPLFLLRENQERYLLYFYEPLDTSTLTGRLKNKVKEVASFYTRAVEDIASQYPSQWYWIHNRWRTRPPNEDRA